MVGAVYGPEIYAGKAVSHLLHSHKRQSPQPTLNLSHIPIFNLYESTARPAFLLTLLLILSPEGYSCIIPFSLCSVFSPHLLPGPPLIFSIHIVLNFLLSSHLSFPFSTSFLTVFYSPSTPYLHPSSPSSSPRVPLPFSSSSSHHSSSCVSGRPSQGPRPARLQRSAGSRASARHSCLPWVRKINQNRLLALTRAW